MNNLYIEKMRNTHKDISKIPYNLLQELMLKNDSVFKLLTFKDIKILESEDEAETDKFKYTEMNIEGNNLTLEEKSNLVFKDYGHSEEYRIQLQPSTDDALLQSQCRLHIYISNVVPVDPYISIVSVNFNVICHNKFNMVDDGKRTRIDCICEELINFYNGIILENTSSEVFFNYNKSNGKDKLNQDLSNLKNYFGDTVTMSMVYGAIEDKSLR